MADDVQESSEPVEITTEKTEDVFVNGDANEKLEECEEEPNTVGELDLPETVLPRRSSLMNKDGGRRPHRKKTVSFSSMPTERKIATGEFYILAC